MTERLLRLAAVVIAIAGVVDPSWTLERPVSPVVAMHVGSNGDELAERVRQALGDDFVLVPEPAVGADARIVVGNDVPAAADMPTFSVVPADGTEIAAIRAPARTPVDARVPVHVTLRTEVSGVPAGEVVRLIVDGLVADERSVDTFTSTAGGLASATLLFTPSGNAPHHVRVTVGEQHVDTLVSVDREPWRVLAHDPRPSWPATFVRRALERDPRFALSARVETSPQSGVASGDPVDLADLDGLGKVDVIVVGAPDALDAPMVALLRAYLRRRGGSVVMLIDRAPGAAAELAGLADWSERITPTPSLLHDADAEPVLRASEIAIPQLLPAAGQPLAGLGEAPNLVPVVWRMPVGRGRLVISGALDAWRFRAADEARFDRFWRSVVADAAAAAAAPLDVDVPFRVGRPGRAVPVAVTLRELALDPAAGGRGRVSAHLEGESGVTSVRLWPAESGHFRGRLRLPESPGSYRLVVESNGSRVTTDLLVRDDAAPAPPMARSHLEAWGAAQSGAVIPATRIDDLAAVLHAAITLDSATVVVHPLRSGWWLVPFAFALGAEWWLRRRRGDR